MISIISGFIAAFTFIAAVIPPLTSVTERSSTEDLFPAPPGYLLPWPGGEIHGVTQGEETTFTHNGLTAYAFDFDLSYDTIVASRSGKVVMVREDSNIGGCNAIFAHASNYVVIDHGDGTSALYLHVAHNAVIVEPGDIVEQGQPIAVSGATGVTCSGVGDGPGPHLHFQVQRTEPGVPLSQSIPVAFDDISRDNGVPREGRSYVSGNFGSGQPQKIKLTPWRVERPFNPVARPSDPTLVQMRLPTPTPMPAHVEDLADPENAEELRWPTSTPSVTATAWSSSTPEPTDTPLPDTSTPTPTPVTPTPTVPPPPTASPPPENTATPPPPPTLEPAVEP